jgi:hypothetical protein
MKETQSRVSDKDGNTDEGETDGHEIEEKWSMLGHLGYDTFWKPLT